MPQNYSSLDPYRLGRTIAFSPVHLLDARVKVLLAVFFILATGFTPLGAWAAYLLLFALIFSVALISDIGLSAIYKRTALALPFVLSALPLLFTVLDSPEKTIALGVAQLTVSLAGFERFASIAVKSWISVQAAVLLAMTTRLPDLLRALRSLRIPRLLVAVIGLMWRYLFLMIDEASRLLRARFSRSAAPTNPKNKTGGPIIWRGKVAGNMAGSLMVRSFERSDRVYSAMLSRGYDGEIRGPDYPPLKTSSWIIFLGFSGLLTVILGFGLLLAA